MTSMLIDSLPVDVQEEIDRLQQQGTSESIICKEIFTTLLEDNNCQSICLCLKTFQDIPEDILVKILAYLLTKITEENGNFDSIIYSYINLVLDTEYTDIFLQEHLKQISVKNTKILLKYLAHCLDSNPSLTKDKRLAVNKILDWLCILLDAQYHTIILSSDKELFTILENLNESVKSKFLYFEELDKLEAVLGILKSKTIYDKDNRDLAYCIEKIVIE